MKAVNALIIVAVLVALPWIGALAGGQHLLGVVIPYLAMVIFLVGMVARVMVWARSPVPFKITTVTGQQRSLPWFRQSKLESPSNGFQTFIRMALEVLLFRSLFRNTRTSLRGKDRLVYQPDRLLWLAALAFHWTFLIVILRHLRFFTEPIPGFVLFLEEIDGMLQLAVPTLMLTDIVIVVALLYLLARRFFESQVRYVSLTADYFALFLLLGIVGSGICIRHFSKVDLMAVKELALGLVTFQPTVPEGVGALFFIHLFLVAALLAYFPFSKLVHLGGVFLSPTRNLANDNRARRHVNPWNRPVEVHTYAEWEDEFRDKIKGCGLPLDKE